MLKRLGWSQKKSLKRDETERQAFRARQAEVGQERLVVLDECGSRTNLTPLYGYAPSGQPLAQSVPRNYGQICQVLDLAISLPLLTKYYFPGLQL